MGVRLIRQGSWVIFWGSYNSVIPAIGVPERLAGLIVTRRTANSARKSGPEVEMCVKPVTIELKNIHVDRGKCTHAFVKL